jgi:outer membrane protein assembly factor BamE (lipoprotein component of BamABCDE complex)
MVSAWRRPRRRGLDLITTAFGSPGFAWDLAILAVPTEAAGSPSTGDQIRMANRKGNPRLSPPGIAKALAASLALGVLLGGCTGETFQKGYLVPEGALEQIPIGASQEQVLIVLGTPSTVATVSGEVFYYISQRAERPIAFMPQEVVDQRVVAVYFDKTRRVERLANYGLKDGKLFDFVSRTTPTSGRELNYLQAILSGLQFKPSI